MKVGPMSYYHPDLKLVEGEGSQTMIDIYKSIKDFKRVPSKEKLLILALLIFAFLAGFTGIVGLSSLNFKQTSSQPTNIKPTPIPANLALGTPTTQLKTGVNFDVVIKLSSKDQEVGAADFVVTFDPAYVKPINITLGDYFKIYPLKKINQNFIKISATASYINNKIIMPKGDGVVATISFTALSPTAGTLISFDKDKTIVASDGKNIVGNLSSLNLSIR